LTSNWQAAILRCGFSANSLVCAPGASMPDRIKGASRGDPHRHRALWDLVRFGGNSWRARASHRNDTAAPGYTDRRDITRELFEDNLPGGARRDDGGHRAVGAESRLLLIGAGSRRTPDGNARIRVSNE
jgi:hypothetical protein